DKERPDDSRREKGILREATCYRQRVDQEARHDKETWDEERIRQESQFGRGRLVFHPALTAKPAMNALTIPGRFINWASNAVTVSKQSIKMKKVASSFSTFFKT